MWMKKKIQVNTRSNTLNNIIWVFWADPVLSGLVELELPTIKPVTISLIAYSALETKNKNENLYIIV